MIRFKRNISLSYEEAIQLQEKHRLNQVSSMQYDIMVEDTKVGIAFHGNKGVIYIAEMINGECFRAKTKKELTAVLNGN